MNNRKSYSVIRSLFAFFALLGVLTGFPSVACSVTLIVNSTADSHDTSPGDGFCSDDPDPALSHCSFRAAIEEANVLSGQDTVLIPGDISPIKLTLGSVVLTDDSTIIVGLDSFPIVDGADNPLVSHILEITSNNNQVTGLTIQRSRRHGILITGSNNKIGGPAESERNILTGNGRENTGSAGVAIVGSSAAGNRVTGNFVGIAGNGTIVKPNRNGVCINGGAHDNLIENNLISGNDYYGIVIDNGAGQNMVSGNIIGPDITCSAGPGNGLGGILIEGRANDNQIGGDETDQGNLISLNGGDGISITGSDRNRIIGNHIGINGTGCLKLGNEGAGVSLSAAATANIIGGTTSEQVNVISGNLRSGLLIRGTGTCENTVRGNYIGVDVRGTKGLGNGWEAGHGVEIDSGASDNLIGGAEEDEGNVISGNPHSGVLISGVGTDRNQIAGNFIGVNVHATSSVPNGTGVVIRDGARRNVIGGQTPAEGNIISGNRGDIFPLGCGVLLTDAGTDHNTISGNYIGLDVTGTRALRNGSAGVVVGQGASYNIIGGETPSKKNVIAGNGVGSVITGIGRGIHVFGTGTVYNRIIGNYIGTSADGLSRVENTGHGISLFDGATDNEIGGDTRECGNLIAMNHGHGIYLSGIGCRSNTIRHNLTRDNDSLAIAVRNGAQGNILPPVISSASTESVVGYEAPPSGQVDVYLVRPDPSNHGEGITLVGSGLADQSGMFVIPVAGLSTGDTISAIVTDLNNNSSEFALNKSVELGTGVEGERHGTPDRFALSQNYPNPFNPVTLIRFYLPNATDIELSVYNLLGQKVTVLQRGFYRVGAHSATWEGNDQTGHPVAAGVYFYRLSAGELSATRKMLLLK